MQISVGSFCLRKVIRPVPKRRRTSAPSPPTPADAEPGMGPAGSRRGSAARNVTPTPRSKRGKDGGSGPADEPDPLDEFGLSGPLPSGLAIGHLSIGPAAGRAGGNPGGAIRVARCKPDLLRSVSGAVIAKKLRLPAEAVAAAIEYWVEARAAQRWRPLLRRLYHPTPREWMLAQESTLSYQVTVSIALRQKLEKLRILLDLSKKREQAKLELALVRRKAFELELEHYTARGGQYVDDVDDALDDDVQPGELEKEAGHASGDDEVEAEHGETSSAAGHPDVPHDVDLQIDPVDVSHDGTLPDEIQLQIRERLSSAIESKDAAELELILGELRENGFTEIPQDLLPLGFNFSRKRRRESDGAAPTSPVESSGFSGFLRRMAVFCGVSDS